MGREKDIAVWREQLAAARKQQQAASLLSRVDAISRPVMSRKPVLTLVWSNPIKLRR